MYPWHVARNASENWVKLSPKVGFQMSIFNEQSMDFHESNVAGKYHRTG